MQSFLIVQKMKEQVAQWAKITHLRPKVPAIKSM